jgi:hypothetical protein
MKYNPKYKAFCFAALFITACNPFQQAKEAAEARQKSDSILKEFDKVNEEIKSSNDSLHHYYDSIYKKQ